MSMSWVSHTKDPASQLELCRSGLSIRSRGIVCEASNHNTSYYASKEIVILLKLELVFSTAKLPTSRVVATCDYTILCINTLPEEFSAVAYIPLGLWSLRHTVGLSSF